MRTALRKFPGVAVVASNLMLLIAVDLRTWCEKEGGNGLGSF